MKRMKLGCRQNWDKIALLLISAFALAFMIRYSGLQSFWFDEVIQIGYVHESLSWKEIIQAQRREITPPLYTFLIAVWYRLAPYGEKWLLLPSEIFVAAGIYFTGLTGVKMVNRRTGVFAAALTAMSSDLFVCAGFEFRMYGLYFMLTAVTAYLYLLRYNERKQAKLRTVLLLGFCMLLLAMTHLFGAVVIAGLFVSDFILFLRRKIQFRCIIPYVMAGVTFLAWALFFLTWFVPQMKSGVTSISFWANTPIWQSCVGLIKEYMNGNSYLFGLYVLALSYSVVNAIYKKAQKNPDFESAYVQATYALIPLFVIGSVFIYSAKINPGGSLFVVRYFIGIIPFLFLTIGVVLDKFCVFFSKAIPSWKPEAVLSVILCASFLFFGIDSYAAVIADQKNIREPYREGAQWLLKKKDIYKKSTLVMLTNSLGFQYFLTQRGTKQSVNYLETEIYTQEEIEQYKKIYVVEIHVPLREDAAAYYMEYFDKIAEPNKYGISVYRRKKVG